jgi:hypothetical protein
MRTVEIISGGLLIIIGLLVFFGLVQRISTVFGPAGTELSNRLDEWLVTIAGGTP